MGLLALTREVTPAIVHCELTHIAREPIDFSRAQSEHALYEAALRSLGCRVERVPTDASMPDAVFIEDTAVVLDEIAVITRPGAASRRGEVDAVAQALGVHRRLERIRPPATLDGGDVLRIGRRLLVGESARTNAAGIEQLRDAVSPHGYFVESIPFRGCLHLKSAVTLVADDLVLINRTWVDLPLHAIGVDEREPFAANALRVGGSIIHGEEYPRTRARLEAHGLTVCPVAAGELAKAEGGVTCCSLLCVE